MGISLQELKKAALTLEQSIKLFKNAKPQSDEALAFRDACLQRFEYTIELSWKLSIKILGSTTAAAKPAIREMARNNLIDDATLWLQFIDARNSTSHSYDENVAQAVYQQIEFFMPELNKLIERLVRL